MPSPDKEKYRDKRPPLHFPKNSGRMKYRGSDTMNDSLTMLLEKAKNDKALTERIYATRTEKNPVNALCELATTEGFPITAAELLYDGEETCAAMCRSVNGGGVETPDGWDDVYEMFFAALDYMKK